MIDKPIEFAIRHWGIAILGLQREVVSRGLQFPPIEHMIYPRERGQDYRFMMDCAQHLLPG